MDYTSALRHVLGLADLERMVEPPGVRPRYDLGRMHALLDALGRPHLSTPTVHVTGTKGKGSTSAMIASVLRASGYTVGLYTSPHLHTMRERIQVNGEPLSEDEFAATVEAVWPSVEALIPDGVTTFETLTAMAFHAFASRKLDWQVLEVGMGGTLDATNTVETPEVCVITSISLDHTKILGDTVEEIARDKGGIIKPGATVVTAPQTPGVIAELEAACARAGAELVRTGDAYEARVTDFDLRGQSFHAEGPGGPWDGWLPLLGEHQVENAVCAIAAAEALAARGHAVSRESTLDGLAKVRWPARLEVLAESPLIVADGAHNPYSAEKLVEAVDRYFGGRRRVLLFGASLGHDLRGIVRALAALEPEAVVVTASRHPRAVAMDTLMDEFRGAGMRAQWGGSVAEGFEQAKALAGSEDLVLATGSLFTAVEVRECLFGTPPEEYPEFQDVRFSSRVR
ncbi:MAG: bifunctional folylpolyglutamate synthase/dihydrofolate synthase [Chloroflexota bacterium]|nr:bifunctional folylpolyglutamate synthase/dihydrofolate synthase [Chloroflexota bacterium]